MMLGTSRSSIGFEHQNASWDLAILIYIELNRLKRDTVTSANENLVLPSLA